MIKGTEKMERYPTDANASMRTLKGINHYGSLKFRGLTAYKVAPANVGQLETLGWHYVGAGSSYCYVVKPGLGR